MIRHLLKLAWNRKRSNLLVIAEIFASFLVVFCVLTLSLYFADNYRRPLGFSFENVWNVQIDLTLSTDDIWTPEDTETFARVLEEAKHFDGVVAAAGAFTVPYNFSKSTGVWELNGRTVAVQLDEVTDDFRQVMGLEVTRGRWFAESDSALGWRPIVIDEEMAHACFDDEDPVGRTLPVHGEKGPEARVVGVVRDFRKDGELAGADSFLFQRVRLLDPESRPPRNILLKMRPGLDASHQEAILARFRALAPRWYFELEPLDQKRATSFQMRLGPLAAGGGVAAFLLLMAGLGLVGVLWQNVTRRTHEIGLRRATGASRADIYRQILLEVALTTTIGLALGVVLVLQLPLLDLLGFLSREVFILGIALSVAAMYILTLVSGVYPALLAARVRPAEAMHQE